MLICLLKIYNNMASKEMGATPPMSRRDFNKIALATLAAVGATALGLDKIIKFLQEPRSESLSDILDEINSKYGISIPSLAGEFTKYQVCSGQDNTLVHCGEEKSTQITQAEAETIKNSLKIMPSAGKFAQLIIPFRNESADAIAGGNNWGRNWDFFLDPSKYQNYPRDRYLSSISAVNLVLPDKGLDEQMPPVTQDSNFLPLLGVASLDEVGIQTKNIVYYPWTNHRERLTQTIIHEIGGHGVIELAGRIKVNYNPEAEYEASAMSLFGGIPLDTNHPIVSSFAKVNGWMLTPYSEFMAQWGDFGRQRSEEVKRTEPKWAGWLVWDRDPKYWGSLEDRTIRLDTYTSYGTIKEAFAQFFMFYSLSRVDNRYDKSLLTDNETKYFDKMFRGLSGNPKKYIQNLIEANPGPSFNSDLFETKTNFKTFVKKMGLKYPHQINGVTNL